MVSVYRHRLVRNRNSDILPNGRGSLGIFCKAKVLNRCLQIILCVSEDERAVAAILAWLVSCFDNKIFRRTREGGHVVCSLHFRDTIHNRQTAIR